MKDMAWRGKAHDGMAPHGNEYGASRHGNTPQDKGQQGTTRHDKEPHSTATEGNVTAQHSTVGHGITRHGTTRNSVAKHGTGLDGMARHSTERHTTARNSNSSHGMTSGGRGRDKASPCPTLPLLPPPPLSHSPIPTSVGEGGGREGGDER